MTQEQEHYIISHWEMMSCEDLRKQFNEKFGTSYKTTAFHYHTKRLGLMKHIQHRYTKEQDRFLKENAGHMTREELADLFNEKFGTAVKLQAIEQRCFLNHWKPEKDGKFRKGDPPWEKAKGGREAYVQKLKGGNSTSFRKGILPHNAHEVGCVKLWGHEVKVKTNSGWMTRRRYLWEQNHGEIPDGHVVISVDGDKFTDDSDCLRIVSNRTLTTLISNNWNDRGKAIVDAGIAYCNLRETLEPYLKEEI